jgi:hypothetical protein
MLLVETRGEHEASEESLDRCCFGRNVREILETREEEGGGRRSFWSILRNDAGVLAGTPGRD